jgi:hypothetical protein
MDKSVDFEQPTSTPNLYFESDKWLERHPCGECLSTNCFTRIFGSEKTLEAKWLCFNCSEDYSKKYGWELVQATLSGEK